MADLLRETLTSPTAFWAAVQALATIAILVYLTTELPRWIQAAVQKVAEANQPHLPEIEGLQFAIRKLSDQDFQSWTVRLYDSLERSKDRFPETAFENLSQIYKRLDLVGQMIDRGYLEQDLLVQELRDSLRYLSWVVGNVDHRSGSRLAEIRARYPRGEQLLSEAAGGLIVQQEQTLSV